MIAVALCQNLAFVRWLVACATAAGAEGSRRQFVQELSSTVDARREAIEHVLLPALRAHGWDAGPADELPVHVALGERLRRWADAPEAPARAELRHALAGIDAQLLAEDDRLARASAQRLPAAHHHACATRLRSALGHQAQCASTPHRRKEGRCCPARDGLRERCPAEEPAGTSS